MFSIDIALRWFKKKQTRAHKLYLIKWWFRLWWDREAVRFYEIPPAVSSRTGDWSSESGDDNTVPWWPWKEPIKCPCPIQLAASHCSPPPLLHFHPSIPQEEREFPLRLASFGRGSWNREPFIGHSLPLKATSEFWLPGGRAQLTVLEWVRDSRKSMNHTHIYTHTRLLHAI